MERLERLIAENRDEMKAEMDSRITILQQNLDLDIGHVSARMDAFESKLEETKQTVKFQPDVSIIIVGLAFTDGEIPRERASALLSEGLKCDPVPEIVNAERTTPRGSGPAVIKVEFRTVQDKIAGLRRKKTLRDNDMFSRVFIHAAKSHTERLINLNFRTLLNELPCGKDYFLTGNGRLVKRDQEQNPRPNGAIANDSSEPTRRRSNSEDGIE